MTIGAQGIAERAAQVRSAAERLRAATVDDRADWLSDAAELLLSEACRSSAALAEATGLSAPSPRPRAGDVVRRALRAHPKIHTPGG